MSFLPDASGPSAPLQSTHAMKDDEADLSHSFSQLTISSQRGSRSSSITKPSTPLKSPSRHASPSPGRPPSHSPSRGLESRRKSIIEPRRESRGDPRRDSRRQPRRESRDDTPPLIRKTSMTSMHSANGTGPARSLSRRSSSSQIVSPPSQTGTPTGSDKNLIMTAPAIAKTYFQAELEAHHGPVSTLKTETVVIVNDAVYGHRFARPRTSKTALSSIVERPERIKAGMLGVSLAYVRLGERHCEGAFPIQPNRNMETLPSIPFRIHKSSRRLSISSPAVTNVHGTKWMEELKLMCESAESILAMGGKELQRPSASKHADQTTSLPEKLHEGDLYLCSESLDAIEGALGAVCEAVDTVFSLGPRRAFVAVRPPGHHCSSSQPSGFCWVNNVHVGIMHGILNHGLTHAAIIDFDLHHGDGSQSITWAHNARATAASKSHAAWKRTSIGYFSLHDVNSFPCETGDFDKVKNASVCIDGAHGQTVWNVHLQPWGTEQEFWDTYRTKYAVLLDKTRKYLKDQANRLKAAKQEPRAVIFLSAGFDASEWEGAGMQRHQANVPTEFYARLTQDIIQIAAEEGLYVEGRVVSVLEGGYSDRALYSGILSHLSGLVGNHSCENPFQEPNDLVAELSAKLATAQVQDEIELSTTNTLASVYPYDPSWWTKAELDKLDELVAQAPEAPPKMLRISSSPAPAYTSPTQSSQAKVVDSLKARRSSSGLPPVVPSRLSYRSPSPGSPAEVTWMMAARELSRLLIPSDRQTDSCTQEDLNAEATRARRERQSSLDESVSSAGHDRPSSRMLLRERKSRATIDPIKEEGGAALTKNRRKTAAAETVEKVGLPTATSPVVAAAADDAKQTQPNLRRTSQRISSVSSFKPISESSGSAELSSSRPATSMDSRPTSRTASTTTTTTTGKTAVKKPRSSLPATRDTSLPPKTPRAASTSEASPGSGPSRGSSSGPPSSKSEQAKDDLSKITSGMKRIKINLITKPKEPKEATESKAEAGDESILSHASSTVPALTTTSESGLSTPVLEHFDAHSDAVSPTTKQAAHPFDSSPAVRSNDEPSDLFVSYRPDGPPPVAVSQQEPLKWLPPTVGSSPVAPATKTPSPSNDKNKGSRRSSVAPFSQASGRRPSMRQVSPKSK